MNRLSEEEIIIAQDMIADGMTYYQISLWFRDNKGKVINPETIRWQAVRSKKPKYTTVQKLKQSGKEKILVLSDLHIPYHRDDILNIVKKHADEISTLILGGDIIDCHPISSFGDLDPKPLHTEMVACHELLKQIEELTPNVERIAIFGNHEARYQKMLERCPSEINSLHSDNILMEICKGFEVHDRLNETINEYVPLDYEVINSWWIKVKNCIVCHPMSFSKVAAKTSQMSLDYFIEREESFDVCLVAHTHKQASCWKYGKYAVEIGSLCKPQSYAESGKLSYTQQQCGYYLLSFTDEKFDINESRCFHLN